MQFCCDYLKYFRKTVDKCKILCEKELYKLAMEDYFIAVNKKRNICS